VNEDNRFTEMILLSKTNKTRPDPLGLSPTMTLETFIEALADGDSNDQEIAGLTEAIRAAVSHLTSQQIAVFEKVLPEILKKARKTSF